MKNTTFNFHFRKQVLNDSTIALLDAIDYSDKVEFLNAEGESTAIENATHVKRTSQSPVVPVVTLEELTESEQGIKVLELMLDKTVTELVRSDFDGGKNPLNGWKGGEVPEGYAVTLDYLLDSLTPSVGGGSSSAAVKVADIKAFFVGMEEWLVAQGKKPAAIALYKSILEGRFKANLIQSLNEQFLKAILNGLNEYVVAMAEDVREEESEVIAYLQVLAGHAIASKASISLDDL